MKPTAIILLVTATVAGLAAATLLHKGTQPAAALEGSPVKLQAAPVVARLRSESPSLASTQVTGSGPGLQATVEGLQEAVAQLTLRLAEVESAANSVQAPHQIADVDSDYPGSIDPNYIAANLEQNVNAARDAWRAQLQSSLQVDADPVRLSDVESRIAETISTAEEMGITITIDRCTQDICTGRIGEASTEVNPTVLTHYLAFIGGGTVDIDAHANVFYLHAK